MNQHEEHSQGRIRQPVPTSGTLLSFDIAEEVRRLQSEQPWQAEHTANTIVKYSDLSRQPIPESRATRPVRSQFDVKRPNRGGGHPDSRLVRL